MELRRPGGVLDSRQMKRLVSLFLLAPLCLSLPSCAGAGTGAEMAAGGVATAAAVAVAIPLMPVAAVYNLPGTIRDRRKESEYWTQSDPVIMKRTEKIRARDPKADARRAWKNGTRAYFRGSDTTYMGLPNEKNFDDKKASAFVRTFSSTPFLSSLKKETEDEFPAPPEVHSWSPARKDLRTASETYRAAFNQEMQRLERGR